MQTLTKYEKAVVAITNQCPSRFFCFMQRGGTLVGIVLDDQRKEEKEVVFTRKEVTLAATAYDLTLGTGHCPYGSRDMWTLTEKYLE